jgi:hypothetical protein
VCCLANTGALSATCEQTCSGLTLCSGQADCAKGERCQSLGPIKACVGGNNGFDGGFPGHGGGPTPPVPPDAG